MADKAHIETDKRIAEVEKELSARYKKAENALYSSFIGFGKTIQDKAKKLLDAISKAENDIEKRKAKAEYQRFIKKDILGSKKFKNLATQMSLYLYDVNSNVAEYTNAQMPSVYALNYNYIGRNLDKDTPDYTFKPITDKDAELYSGMAQYNVSKSKDTKWNEKNIKKAVTVGGLLALGVNEIFKRTSKSVASKNYNSAVMNNSGQLSYAENYARLDSMRRASDEGFKRKKVWRAMLDNRTRDSHARLDGVAIPLGQKFDNGLLQPRDRNGTPEEVCNCRCSLWYDVGQSRSKTRVARQGEVTGSYKKSSSFKGTKSIEVPNMTYEEWKKWRMK